MPQSLSAVYIHLVFSIKMNAMCGIEPQPRWGCFILGDAIPNVAALRQRWAGGLNPFGVRSWFSQNGRTRDLLLPKLISGTLDVAKLNIETA